MLRRLERGAIRADDGLAVKDDVETLVVASRSFQSFDRHCMQVGCRT
jgi:hypothetical protein